MKRILCQVICIALSAIVVIASVGAGVARGQAEAAGTVVLCRGHVTVTVAVDSDGQPIERTVLCPDCVQLLFSMLPDPAPKWVNWAAARVSVSHAGIEFQPPQQIGNELPRGPPASV